MKHFSMFTGMCASVALVLPVLVSPVYAQTAWSEPVNIDLGAFRSLFTVPAAAISVPTVLEVPLAGGEYRTAPVVVGSDGKYGPALYRPLYEEVSIDVVSSGTTLPALVDNDVQTTVDLPYVDGSANIISFTLSNGSGLPISTSELRFVLAPYVALPKTVTVQVRDGSEGVVSTVLASRPLSDTVVHFPETTARTFLVTFELVQPLHLAELRLVPARASLQGGVVRFLAQPGVSYSVYLSPERPYGILPGEGVDLSTDVGVVRSGAGVVRNNPLFVPTDSDRDGVPEERDNCAKIANSDQRDVDGNGRGDVCDDFDRDGVMNVSDNCPNTPNRYQEDTDHDGVGDLCDERENRFTERYPFVPWVGMGIAALTLIGLLVLTIHGKGGSARREEDAAA